MAKEPNKDFIKDLSSFLEDKRKTVSIGLQKNEGTSDLDLDTLIAIEED